MLWSGTVIMFDQGKVEGGDHQTVTLLAQWPQKGTPGSCPFGGADPGVSDYIFTLPIRAAKPAACLEALPW